MESPGRHDRRHGEQRRQERHHHVVVIALDGQAHRREKTGWQQEGEKRLRPCGQKRCPAEHDTAHCEDDQDLVRGLAGPVEHDRAGPPPGAAIAAPTTNAGFHRSASSSLGDACRYRRTSARSRRGDQQHVHQPGHDDHAGDRIPVRVGEQRGDDDGDDRPGVGVLVQQAGFCRTHLPSMVAEGSI